MSELRDLIDRQTSRGRSWEALLYFHEHDAIVVHDIGRPSTARVAFHRSHADPVWTPQGSSEPVYIGELAPSHRVNLYRFLMKRAAMIEQSVSLSWMTGPFAPTGDWACDMLDRLTDEMADNPEAWLASTPFMRALAALILGDGNREMLELFEYRATPRRRA